MFEVATVSAGIMDKSRHSVVVKRTLYKLAAAGGIKGPTLHFFPTLLFEPPETHAGVYEYEWPLDLFKEIKKAPPPKSPPH